jgi:WD40 repeat protein
MDPGRPVHDLIRDYLDVLDRVAACPIPRARARALQGYYRFVSSQGHRLEGHPELTLPLAVAQPEDSPVRTDALTFVGQGRGPRRPWFCLMNPPATDLNPALRRTLTGHAGGVTAVAVDAAGRTAISGGEDGAVRVWDLHTGRCRIVFPCEANVDGVAITPQSPWIVVVGDRGGRIQFFRLEGW